jgi:hypothetical protein
MTHANATLGQEVVRATGDYVIGRIGTIIALDVDRNRAQVQWTGENATWVSFNAIEPTAVPYKFVKGAGRWPKYTRI